MKKTKKIISLILAFIIAVMTSAVLFGCSSKTAGETYMIYFSNATADDVAHVDYKLTDYLTKDMYTKVSELIHQMYDVDYTDQGCFSAKPANVKINDYLIDENGLITIDFSEEYLEMTNVQEIILRSALVLTVIQVEGIIGVQVTVQNDPIRYSTGAAIGIMTADDFVNILLNDQGMLKQETDVTIFFADAEGQNLVPVTSHFVTAGNNTSMEEYILKQLLAGPEEGKNIYPTIDPATEFISVVTTDNVCYVNFGSSFLEQEGQPVSDELLIYSIVNSLCRLKFVDSVQFLIDGEPGTVLHTVTDISKPFTRNRNLETTLE